MLKLKNIGLFAIYVLLGLSMSGQSLAQKMDKNFFNRIKTEKVQSDQSVEWKNFGPGMSGYCEEFWCHPTDTNVMFMGPDMHVTYGTWDNGKSWHTIKDSDGDGKDLERTLDIVFSLQNPDYGVALERYGNIFETKDRGRTWKLVYTITEKNNPVFKKNSSYNAFTKIAIHPTNDNIWFIGVGNFWDVKANHKTQKNPNGLIHSRASYGYILKTTDKGKSWTKIANHISDELDVARIIINPANADHMIIATSHGVYTSSDGGDSWKASSKGLPNNLPRDLCSYYNPKTKEFVLYLVEQTVYTAKGKTTEATGGVYKSVDGGASWINITGNLGINLSVIADSGVRDRYHRTISHWFGIDKNVSKKTYTTYPDKTLSVYNRIVVNPLDKNEIYLSHNKKHDRGFGPGEVWKTENGGKTWFACVRDGKYWIAEKDKAYWQEKNNPTGANIEFAHIQGEMDEGSETAGNRMMAINAKGDVFLGIAQQTVRSNNKGASWQQVDDYETAPGSNAWVGRGGSDLPGRFMLLETGIEDRYLLCSGEHGLWETTDLGTYPDKDAVAVKQIEGQVHDHSGNHASHSTSTVAVHPNDTNTIYILSWRQEHRGKLRRTQDGGKTWENISTIFDGNNNSWEGLAMTYSLQIDPNKPDNMYFCSIRKPISEVGSSVKENILTKGGYGVYRSTDAGYTWTLSNEGLPAKCSVRRLTMDPQNPEIIYASVNQKSDNDPGGLYKSTDKAMTWSKVKVPAVVKSVNNLFIDRNTNYMYISCGTRSGEYISGGVWLSKDNGKKWEKIFKAPYVWQTEISPVNSDIILVNVPAQVSTKFKDFKNPGLYLSKDAGKSWTKINKGIGQPDKMVDAKPDPYHENIIWSAGWGSGWFKAIIKE
ncbi:WD40/YVTN/BNR-like repeat-containing protein [Labilibaculum antarcticum]|uniref:Sortilin N-terminal domain-containing protein n=1 Tax=Labilibaculum antarcticum TaxID=1717717 RepID=A0A1Y1CKZ9_9BACT|nr:hypothetical protein [Labilibaculum antarcticum]BAX81079.1 hypothetical protein ALGA_2767 [Labilibaculum antarcticum]